jgi:hypothetical protein
MQRLLIWQDWCLNICCRYRQLPVHPLLLLLLQVYKVPLAVTQHCRH